MPISPIVQQHQKSIVQQSSSPGQLTYNKEFGEAAYELLGAKYPRLLPFVVTFKILDQGDTKEKDGAGVGVFVISRREDVGYIPVVMSNGSIVSCEMVYDKDKDTLFPLIPKMIKQIVGENMTQEHSLVRSPTVENTRELYQNMFRPPISSRPVLAGATDLVESLPDDAKDALRTYFYDNPQILAKVAEFYPVEKLASKLACGGTEATKQAAEKSLDDFGYLDKVVRLEDLTKEAAENLPVELKAEVLEAGFAITETPESPPRVYTEDALPSIAEEVFNASEVQLIYDDNRYFGSDCGSVEEANSKAKVFGTGCLLRYDGSEFIKEPCLVSGSTIVTHKGCYQSPATLVLTNFKEGIQEEDLSGFGLISPEDIEAKKEVRATVFYPVKRGGYKSKEISVYEPKKISGDGGFLEITGDYADVGFSWNVEYGAHSMGAGRYGGNIWVFPASSMVHQHDGFLRELPGFYIRSMSALVPLLMRASTNLQLVKDAGDHTLINRTTGTTEKFASAPELVNHLVTAYHFDKTAADTLLDKKKVYFAKEAYQLPMGSSEHPSNSMWAAPQQQQQQQMQPQEETRIIDGSMIEDLAEFEDPDMLDTGMIGSLAHADDIKSLLLDSVQSFEDTVTDIGKSMLLFAINKQEMEDHYGREDYSSVMHNLNTGFSTLGGLVFDIKEYTNNATYTMDDDA